MATHYDYLLRASRCSGAGPAPSARENQTTRAVFNDLFKRMIISNQGRSRDAGARTTALGHARRRRDTNALRSVARRLAETPRRRARLSRGRHRKRSAACEASLLELLEECQPACTILLAALADAENLAIALAVDRRRHPTAIRSSLRPAQLRFSTIPIVAKRIRGRTGKPPQLFRAIPHSRLGGCGRSRASTRGCRHAGR